MTEKETKKTEQGLNEPKSNEEMFDAINTAVSEGNQEEVDRLMALEPNFEGSEQTSPDATDDDSTDEDRPANKAGSSQKQKSTDDPDNTTSESSDNPEAAPDAASVPDSTPKEPTVKELMEQVHALKSAAGRVDYLQARLTQLEQERRRESKKKPEKAPEPEQPTSRKSDERISKLKDIDPDMAETLELLRDEVRQEMESKYGKPAPAQQDDDLDEETNQEISRIERVHPEIKQIFWGQYRPAWDNWKNSLTPEQRAWAESDKAEEVIVALSAFKQTVAQQQAPAAPESKGGDPVNVDGGSEPDPAVDATNKARERKLQSSSGTKNTTIKSQGALDRDKLFTEMYDQIQKDDHLIGR